MEGGYLIVDELENHINEEIVTTLVRFFMNPNVNKNGATLIYSTHYSELLDEYERNDCIYIVRNRGGIYAENLSLILKRNDIKKSEAYESGYLEGTVPVYEAYMALKKVLSSVKIEEDEEKKNKVYYLLDHIFMSPAPRPTQATFASFMGTDEPDERPQAKWNAPLDGLTPSEIQAHIDQLYTSEVTSALRDMVHAYDIAMGVAVSRVSVRSMKTRWGSCTPKFGAIRIARELAAYPIECLDMVVAHELVHLLEPSHYQRVHALLDTYCPNNRALSQRLKKPPANEP